MIRCQIVVFEVAFNGGVECTVIHVDIFQHSGFIDESSTFIGLNDRVWSFLSATAFSSLCGIDFTCHFLRNWRLGRFLLRSVSFQPQLNIRTDLLALQRIKVMLVF